MAVSVWDHVVGIVEIKFYFSMTHTGIESTQKLGERLERIGHSFQELRRTGSNSTELSLSQIFRTGSLGSVLRGRAQPSLLIDPLKPRFTIGWRSSREILQECGLSRGEIADVLGEEIIKAEPNERQRKKYGGMPLKIFGHYEMEYEICSAIPQVQL